MELFRCYHNFTLKIIYDYVILVPALDRLGSMPDIWIREIQLKIVAVRFPAIKTNGILTLLILTKHFKLSVLTTNQT